MKKTGWYRPDQVPARQGWYERDHRKAGYLHKEDERISLDLWEPDNDKTSICYPGVWYVQDEPHWWCHPVTGAPHWMNGINDASRQHLPWRGLTEPSA